MYVFLNNNQKWRQSDVHTPDVRSQLEQKIQKQETENSGWRFERIQSMTL